MEKTKKKKLFSINEFETEIKSDNKTPALENFLKAIKNNKSDQDCILEYLEHKGKCVEILKILQEDPNVPPTIIFEIINEILLRITAKYRKYNKIADRTCQYLLTQSMPLINRMLSVESKPIERTVVLKLLTSVVAYGPTYAKEILLHLDFNLTNLNEIVHPSPANHHVRQAFIKFLIAFLICGHYPSVVFLLEKKHVVTSIVKGLKYDPADIVLLVLTTMKKHILLNFTVTKTVKLHMFSTLIIRQIVDLYNWCGPKGYGKRNADIKIDETDKIEVNETVHDFLLTLCTSYKYGLIFSDPSIGLSGQHSNQLMYTVLVSLEKPWMHSYVADLTVQICKTCPDLVRWQWTNLTKHLEPRDSDNWKSTMKFAELLLRELTPNCIEFAVQQLDTQQLLQVIRILVLPLPVLKLLVTEENFKTPSIKLEILQLLKAMLTVTDDYLKYIKQNWLHFDYAVVDNVIKKHITGHFPNALMILSNLEAIDDNRERIEYLEICFDLIDNYVMLVPELLDCLNDYNVKDFLLDLLKIDNQTKLGRLLVKICRFLLNFNPDLFKLHTELFEIVLTTIFQFYYQTHRRDCFNCLQALFDNIGIIKHDEIQIWIDGILNLKQYKPEIIKTLIDLFRKSGDNVSQTEVPSSMLMIVFLSNHQMTVAFKNYFLFIIFNLCHLNSDNWQFCSKFDFIPTQIREYFDNWSNGQITVFGVSKNFFEQFQQFSERFFNGKFDEFLDNTNLDVYPNFKLNLLQMTVFYLNKLLTSNLLEQQHLENTKFLIKTIFTSDSANLDAYFGLIFKNPTFLDNINIYKPGDLFTDFVMDTIRMLQEQHYDLADYLSDFRRMIVGGFRKFLKRPKDREINYDIFKSAYLRANDHFEILSRIPDDTRPVLACYPIFIDCLNQLSTVHDYKPLPGDIIERLCDFYVNFANNPQLPELSVALLKYLRCHSDCVQSIKRDLIGTILQLNDYNRDNLEVCRFLFDKNPAFFDVFETNLDQICEKKGFILNLLDLVIEHRQDLLAKIAENLQPTLMKILTKPHKANQHFHNFYRSVGALIDRCPIILDDFCGTVQRYQTTEVFHVYLLNKIYGKIEKNPTILTNMLLTFIYLEMNLFRQQFDQIKVGQVSEIVYEFLQANDLNLIDDFTTINKNDSFNQFVKFCLKYGVSGECIVLLKILQKFVNRLDKNGELVFEMMLSHSKFLDVLLDVGNQQHRQLILELWRDLLVKWPELMRRPHVPTLLSAYSATRSNVDRIILDLLKLYQTRSQETGFYDFKPFLWGISAASFYSIRSQIDTVLHRQPKMNDILSNLDETIIQKTITNPNHSESYDLDFFLPLFDHLLAQENRVQIFQFPNTGALSLTIIGLSNDNYETRLAACHILSRFYHHLEARQKGKYHLLWLHLTEMLCRGTAILKGFKMNNFASTFMARMVLILNKPLDKMYGHLTNYLLAKPVVDFTTIPELYKFLHHDRNCREFILEVIRDGCRTNDDFIVFMKSMAFKLLSELCSSRLCDTHTRKLIFDIFNNCCRLQLGWVVLNKKCSFSAQIYALWHLIGDKFNPDYFNNNDYNEIAMDTV